MCACVWLFPHRPTLFCIDQTAGFQETLTEVEILALIVGCVCHDLDHRGTNNAFQAKYVVLPSHPVSNCLCPAHKLRTIRTTSKILTWIVFVCVCVRTGSALALLYGTSATLEHHHFNHAVMILQSEVHRASVPCCSAHADDCMLNLCNTFNCTTSYFKFQTFNIHEGSVNNYLMTCHYMLCRHLCRLFLLHQHRVKIRVLFMINSAHSIMHSVQK